MPLPQDPAMCDDLQVSQTEICGVLSAIGYTYDEKLNRFI